MSARTIAERLVSAVRSGVPQAQPFREIAEALCPPWDGNHVVLPHASIGEVLADEVKSRSAAVYIFDFDAVKASMALVSSRNPRRARLAYSMARFPSKRFWLEYHYQGIHKAIYVDTHFRVNGVTQGIYFTCYDQDEFFPLFHFDFAEGEEYDCDEDGRGSHFNWSPFTDYFKPRPEDEVLIATTPTIFRGLLAFLAVGGATVSATERRPVKLRRPGPSKVTGFLSINKTRLAMPAGASIKTSNRSGRGAGVRFHDVRGHYREISVGGQKVLRFIAAFWRGNPRLGIVQKHRYVVGEPTADCPLPTAAPAEPAP